MTLFSALAGRALGMPPARTRTVRVRRDIPIPMTDGVHLLADHHVPGDDPEAPLVLIRSPYGRGNNFYLGLLAERGYQVLTVSLRGTAGSGGRFTGFRLERQDGADVLAWLRDQEWFPGAFATWGASFLGYSQWDLASVGPIPEWKAAFMLDAPSEVHDSFMFRDGVFPLDDWVGWSQTMAHADRTMSTLSGVLAMPGLARRRRAAIDRLPVTEADQVAAGQTIDFFQEWLRTPGPWPDSDYRDCVDRMPPVVCQVGGWQDIFLPGVLADHEALVRSGRQVRLRVGPWTHGRGMFDRQVTQDLFATLEYALRGVGDLPDAPVRVFVGGAGDRSGWRDLDRWPPEGGRRVAWYPHADRTLSTTPPGPDEPTAPSGYRYDPMRPTPSVGGAILRAGGVRDNRALERRPDVLVFTGAELPQDLEILGEVEAEIRLRSSLPYADVFVRLCDVAPNGRSLNVCDGILRLGDDDPTDADGVRTARVRLWPTAYVFRAGHRIRLQVSGGAHPRFVRNLGTADQLGNTALASDHEVLHDPDHRSAILLPERTS